MPDPEERQEPEASPYLRRQKRVEVRRGASRWKKVGLIAAGVVVLSGSVLAAAGYAVGNYLSSSPYFILSESLATEGLEHVTRDQVNQIFSADRGRSIYEIPLEQRCRQVMSIAWVETAYVSRSWPNRLRVAITERKPIAFARPSSTKPGALALIDRDGILMPVPRKGKFSLPVLTGVDQSQTIAERKKRVDLMRAVLEDLDRDKPRRSTDVSEIDLSDPADAAITVSESGVAVVVHLGNENFLERYKLFLQNVEGWRDQYGSVRSVDLRYDKQVVVKP